MGDAAFELFRAGVNTTNFVSDLMEVVKESEKQAQESEKQAQEAEKQAQETEKEAQKK